MRFPFNIFGTALTSIQVETRKMQTRKILKNFASIVCQGRWLCHHPILFTNPNLKKKRFCGGYLPAWAKIPHPGHFACSFENMSTGDYLRFLKSDLPHISCCRRRVQRLSSKAAGLDDDAMAQVNFIKHSAREALNQHRRSGGNKALQ